MSRTSLKSEIGKHVAAAKAIHVPWWAALGIVIGTILIGLAFDRWGVRDLLSPTLNAAIVVVFVLIVNWKHWRQAWFWAATALMVAIHLLVVFLTPWTTTWTPAFVIGAIDSLDICLMLAVFVMVRRAWQRNSGAANSGFSER